LITLSLIFPAYELILGDLRKNWKRLAPFLLVSFIWSIFYVFQIGGRVESLKDTHFVPNNLNNPLIYLPTAFATYLKLIFWPDKLALNHVEVSFQTAGQLTLNWIIFLSFILVYIWSLLKNKLIFFGLSFFIIGLLITLTPFHIANIVAERYVYLSSIGLFLLLAIIFSKLTIQYSYYIYILYFSIVISLSVRTIVRNTDWKDQQGLYQSGINTFPNSAESHVFYGYQFAQNGDFDKAIIEFQQAIKLNPWVAESYHNLSDLYRRSGQYDQAISLDQKALSLKPDLWEAYLNLAEAYLARDNFSQATASINKAIGLKPQEASLYYVKALIYLKQGNKEKAKENLLIALKANPTDPRFQILLKELNQ
jgi:tetratricopeptide (TPR) repeat protein